MLLSLRANFKACSHTCQEERTLPRSGRHELICTRGRRHKPTWQPQRWSSRYLKVEGLKCERSCRRIPAVATGRRRSSYASADSVVGGKLSVVPKCEAKFYEVSALVNRDVEWVAKRCMSLATVVSPADLPVDQYGLSDEKTDDLTLKMQWVSRMEAKFLAHAIVAMADVSRRVVGLRGVLPRKIPIERICVACPSLLTQDASVQDVESLTNNLERLMSLLPLAGTAPAYPTLDRLVALEPKLLEPGQLEETLEELTLRLDPRVGLDPATALCMDPTIISRNSAERNLRKVA